VLGTFTLGMFLKGTIFTIQGTYKGLAKVAVQCSADTFVVKIATFTKPETVGINTEKKLCGI